MASYVFESIVDAFSFGKYKELSLGDVIERNYEYIYWCVANVDIRFSEECIAEMKDMYPDFVITKSFDSHINHIMFVVDDDCDDSDCCSNDNWDDEWQDDWREEPTYDRYGGSCLCQLNNSRFCISQSLSLFTNPLCFKLINHLQDQP